MVKEVLDCRGLACPAPVVETKKKLEQISAGVLTVLVDNDTAKNNLFRLAESLGLKAEYEKKEDEFRVVITKEQEAGEVLRTTKAPLLIKSDLLGQGNDELGGILMRSFLYALSECDNPPPALYLVNTGVRLACEGSPVLDSLEKLKNRGTEILSCGLCLDFLQLKEKLAVGEVTNMYNLVDSLTAQGMTVL